MRTAPYTVGQAVEARTYDWQAPSMPVIWVRAEVTAVQQRPAGLCDVTVRMPDGETRVELVGPRGGGGRIRPIREG